VFDHPLFGRPAERQRRFFRHRENSYYIEDGAIAYPIRKTMVSGNMASLLTTS